MPDESRTRAYISLPAAERLRLLLVSDVLTEGSWTAGMQPAPLIKPGDRTGIEILGTYWVNHINGSATYRAQAQDAQGNWQDVLGIYLLVIADQDAFIANLPILGSNGLANGITYTTRKVPWAERPPPDRTDYLDEWELVFSRTPGWSP
jgi:hypothetical protein